MDYRDSKEKQSHSIAFRVKRARRLDSLEYQNTNKRVREFFYRKPYGKIGERGECYGER